MDQSYELAGGYRRRATELRRTADEMQDGETKRGLLSIAANYEHLAASIESIGSATAG